jgi:hypothetical protein
VSVNTGKVLAAITVTKIVYSTADSIAVLKYIDNKNIGSQIFGGAENVLSLTGSMFEAESGLTINEPGTLAVKATVEAAVVELIKEGEKKGVWDFKKDLPPVVQAPTVVEPVKVAPVVAVEVKKETSTENNKPTEPTEKTVQYTLIENSYLYSQPDTTAQKRWALDKGTQVLLIPHHNDWYFADDKKGHKGYIKKSATKDQ